jgi:hypothetical protein
MHRSDIPGCLNAGKGLPARTRELVGGNDELSGRVATHAVNGAGCAGADGIGVATRMFSGDGYGAICASNDGTFMVKGIIFTEVDDESGVFGTAGESDGGADLDAERFVAFRVGDARCRGGVVPSAAPDIDGARRGSGPASVGLGANACGIRRGANVIFGFLLGVLCQ